jgi:hypothetical protein
VCFKFNYSQWQNFADTVIDKKIADKNICGKYFRGTKMTLLASENSHLVPQILLSQIFLSAIFFSFTVWDENIFAVIIFALENNPVS